ncbi:hypothetical protein LC593_16625 [Nostoc sp. CHAB 5844]|nr:hypothetical protein [Nostoc sp. CHAB 5844]
MYDKNPITICLAVLVSLAATIIGINNLVWFIQTVSPETIKIDQHPRQR